MVGFAKTAMIRARDSVSGPSYMQKRMDYLDYVAASPRPSVVVIEDKDEPAGYGAFWGEVQTNVHKALGCLGTVTNGSIRDIAAVAESFQMLAGSIAPSHAYEHVVEFDISSRDYAEHDGRSCCNHLLAHYSVLLMFHRRWIASARTAVIVLLRLGGLMHFRWLLKSSSSAAFLLMAVLAARQPHLPRHRTTSVGCGGSRTRLARLVCSLH